jgi:hypothetical protein
MCVVTFSRRAFEDYVPNLGQAETMFVFAKRRQNDSTFCKLNSQEDDLNAAPSISI